MKRIFWTIWLKKNIREASNNLGSVKLSIDDGAIIDVDFDGFSTVISMLNPLISGARDFIHSWCNKAKNIMKAIEGFTGETKVTENGKPVRNHHYIMNNDGFAKAGIPTDIQLSDEQLDAILKTLRDVEKKIGAARTISTSHKIQEISFSEADKPEVSIKISGCRELTDEEKEFVKFEVRNVFSTLYYYAGTNKSSEETNDGDLVSEEINVGKLVLSDIVDVRCEDDLTKNQVILIKTAIKMLKEKALSSSIFDLHIIEKDGVKFTFKCAALNGWRNNKDIDTFVELVIGISKLH